MSRKEFLNPPYRGRRNAFSKRSDEETFLSKTFLLSIH
jgi:hypothetical protein